MLAGLEAPAKHLAVDPNLACAILLPRVRHAGPALYATRIGVSRQNARRSARFIKARDLAVADLADHEAAAPELVPRTSSSPRGERTEVLLGRGRDCGTTSCPAVREGMGSATRKKNPPAAGARGVTLFGCRPATVRSTSSRKARLPSPQAWEERHAGERCPAPMRVACLALVLGAAACGSPPIAPSEAAVHPPSTPPALAHPPALPPPSASAPPPPASAPLPTRPPSRSRS